MNQNESVLALLQVFRKLRFEDLAVIQSPESPESPESSALTGPHVFVGR